MFISNRLRLLRTLFHVAFLFYLVIIGIVADEELQADDTCDQRKYGYFCKFRQTCGNSNQGSQNLDETTSGYILSGDNVELGEFPSLAQLHVNYKGHCSAVIVSDYHLLTASHCVFRGGALDPVVPEDIRIVVGQVKSFLYHEKDFSKEYYNQIQVAKVCAHPSGNDVVILTLKTPLTFDEYVQPACWPFESDKIITKGRASNCYQVGAGYRVRKGSSVRPLEVVQKLRVQEHENANNDNSRAFISLRNGTGPGAICRGDSGGPTLCPESNTGRWTVIGVASRGMLCTHDDPWYLSARLDSELARLTLDECAPGLGKLDVSQPFD